MCNHSSQELIRGSSYLLDNLVCKFVQLYNNNARDARLDIGERVLNYFSRAKTLRRGWDNSEEKYIVSIYIFVYVITDFY